MPSSLYATKGHAPQTSRIGQKKSHEMVLVDEQCKKIAKIFGERERTNQTLTSSIDRLTAQLDYKRKLTLEQRHKNARLATSNENHAEVLPNLKELVRKLVNDQIEPLERDFQDVAQRDSQIISLKREMELDLAMICRVFDAECRVTIEALQVKTNQVKATIQKVNRDLRDSNFQCDNLLIEIGREKTTLKELRQQREEIIAENIDAEQEYAAALRSIQEIYDKKNESQHLCDELKQQITNKELQLHEYEVQTENDLKKEQERAATLDKDIELVRIGIDAHIQKADNIQAHSCDQKARCEELRGRCADLHARTKNMQAEQVALETTTQQVQQEIFVVNEEQQLARARVLFAQNITTSLTESITAQQERMTQTVRLHDERQAQQDKLYQALQRKKDEYRRNVLEASQRAQDLRAEIPRVKAEYAEQTKTLASMKKELAADIRKQQKLKQSSDKIRVTAVEAEAALTAYKNSRAEQYMHNLLLLESSEQVRIDELCKQCAALQQQEQDLHSRKSELTIGLSSKKGLDSLLSLSESEIDKIVADSVEKQRESLEAALQQEMAPQLLALEELQSGRRLELEKRHRENAMAKLKARIVEVKAQTNALILSSNSSDTGTGIALEDELFGEQKEMASHMNVHTTSAHPHPNLNPPPPPYPARRNLMSLGVLKTKSKMQIIYPAPVSPASSRASAGDWFNDANMW